MNRILVILRYLLSWMTPVPWPYYVGMTLMPLALLGGLFFPHPAFFGFAVWAFGFLLAVPLFGQAFALRALLSKRRLMLLPGFAVITVLTAFIQTILTAGFLPFFAWLNDINFFSLNVGLYIFVGASIYTMLTFLISPMRWGLQLLSIFLGPILIVSNKLEWLRMPVLSADHLYWLTLTTGMGWLLAVLLAAKTSTLRPPVGTSNRFPNFAITPGGNLPSGGSNYFSGSPSLSLLFGYPADNFSVLRRSLLASVFGLLPFLGFMWIAGIFTSPNAWPKILQLLLLMYLFTTAIIGFQNSELIARTRLLWLRAPKLRHEMWSLLETQQWLIRGSLALLISPLVIASGFVLAVEPLLLLHYPVLILALNAYTSYHTFCAKIRGWHTLLILLAALVPGVMTLVLVFGGHSRSHTQLIAFEVFLLAFALCWRHLAKTRFDCVDWQILKPVSVPRGATV